MIRRLGTACLGVPFVLLGWDAVSEPGPRVAMAAGLGVPRPEDAVRLNGAVMVLGGLGLCLGVGVPVAAAGLAACMLPTTLAGHAFWADDDPAARKANRIHFMKNLGLTGALVAVAATGGQQAGPGV